MIWGVPLFSETPICINYQLNLRSSTFLWMVMLSPTSRFLKSFCGFGAQTCPFDMMKVRGHHPTSYTITLNQRHYGILVYSGRCRTLDRSCPQFNCVCFSWLFCIDKSLADFLAIFAFQEEFLVQTKVSRGSREVHIHPHCLLKNSKATQRPSRQAVGFCGVRC